MFAFSPDGAWIATDTLATTMEGNPHLLVSKCFIASHLELAVAFTGVANVGQEWTQWVQSRMLARDIDMLDLHTPEALRSVHEQLKCPDDATATIYHLGFSPESDKYVGYVYRSTSDYESEELPESGFAIKPQPADIEAMEPPGGADEIIALAESVRASEGAKPRGERIYIGGELILTQLHEHVITATKIHQFADFEEAWLAMNANLNRGV